MFTFTEGKGCTTWGPGSSVVLGLQKVLERLLEGGVPSPGASRIRLRMGATTSGALLCPSPEHSE